MLLVSDRTDQTSGKWADGGSKGCERLAQGTQHAGGHPGEGGVPFVGEGVRSTQEP